MKKLISRRTEKPDTEIQIHTELFQILTKVEVHLLNLPTTFRSCLGYHG